MSAAGIEPVIADITRPETLPGISINYDWTVLCVSASGGGVDEYRRVYLEGTRNVLAWLETAPPHKLLYTSSTAVYGQTDGSWVNEASPTKPEADTAKILLKTEQLLRNASQSGRIPSVILRVAGIYGPERGYWLKQFLSGQARLEGGGTRMLNMIHLQDVVGSILRALERGYAGETYNVVDDEPVSQRALFEWLSAKLGRPLPAAAPEDAVARKRGVTNKAVSNLKLKTKLGWELHYPTFREGFAAELARVLSCLGPGGRPITRQ